VNTPSKIVLLNFLWLLEVFGPQGCRLKNTFKQFLLHFEWSKMSFENCLLNSEKDKFKQFEPIFTFQSKEKTKVCYKYNLCAKKSTTL
jgi:hypothetical protein